MELSGHIAAQLHVAQSTLTGFVMPTHVSTNRATLCVMVNVGAQCDTKHATVDVAKKKTDKSAEFRV